MNNLKIGFFGGCFNPPTIAHIELAKKAIEVANLKVGEEEELESKRKLMMSAEKINKNLLEIKII